MKKIAFLLLFFSGFLSAQVGINTNTPSPASVLHLESLNGSNTHGGFMPPVVSAAEKLLIPKTAADDGMMIYLSEGTTRCLQIYNASDDNWVDMYCMPIPAPPSLTYYQDFENTPNTPELTFSGGSGSTSSGAGDFPASDMFSEGTQGYEVSNTTSTLAFDAIDTSAFTNIDLSFDLASFAGTSGNGADGADFVQVLVSTDNSIWSSEVIVEGNSNANWDFNGTAIASGTYDGNNSPITYSAPGGGNISGGDAYSTVTLSGLPVTSTLYIQIVMTNNSSNETWVVDNVILSLN